MRVKRSIKNARGGESQRRFAAPRVCFLPFCGRLSCTYLLKDRRKKEASAAGKVKIFRESRAGITSLKYGFGDIDILITAVVDIRCVAGKTAAAECHRHVGGYVLQQYGRFVVEKLVSRKLRMCNGNAGAVEVKSRRVVLKAAVLYVDPRISVA